MEFKDVFVGQFVRTKQSRCFNTFFIFSLIKRIKFHEVDHRYVMHLRTNYQDNRPNVYKKIKHQTQFFKIANSPKTAVVWAQYYVDTKVAFHTIFWVLFQSLSNLAAIVYGLFVTSTQKLMVLPSTNLKLLGVKWKVVVQKTLKTKGHSKFHIQMTVSSSKHNLTVPNLAKLIWKHFSLPLLTGIATTHMIPI